MTTETSADTSRCDTCGIVVAGGSTGCQSLFEEHLGLHFSRPTYFGVHRLFVDTYFLQHPERSCASFKSLAAHLGHLCWSLERGGSRAIPSEHIRRWVERHPQLDRPAPPESRGRLMIGYVAQAGTPADHHRAVEQWARATTDIRRTGNVKSTRGVSRR